jgi:hypothetical protein
MMYPISPPPEFTGMSEAPAAWVPYVRQGFPRSLLDEALADGRLTAGGLDRLALLLNPRHPSATQAEILAIEASDFDPRLWHPLGGEF